MLRFHLPDEMRQASSASHWLLVRALVLIHIVEVRDRDAAGCAVLCGLEHASGAQKVDQSSAWQCGKSMRTCGTDAMTREAHVVICQSLSLRIR